MAPDDRSAELYASTIFGLTIATVTVALRCYVRLCMLKIFSWEDYLAVVSLVRPPSHLPTYTKTLALSNKQLTKSRFSSEATGAVSSCLSSMAPAGIWKMFRSSGCQML